MSAGVIVVVDDDDAVREVVTEMLELSGYPVVPVATAVGLSEVVARLEPALILLDLYMAPVSGDVALSRLRELGVTTPIVVYSAARADRTGRSIEHWVKELGASGWIAKPFQLNLLLATVEQLMGTPHQAHETSSDDVGRGE